MIARKLVQKLRDYGSEIKKRWNSKIFKKQIAKLACSVKNKTRPNERKGTDEGKSSWYHGYEFHIEK